MSHDLHVQGRFRSSLSLAEIRGKLEPFNDFHDGIEQYAANDFIFDFYCNGYGDMRHDRLMEFADVLNKFADSGLLEIVDEDMNPDSECAISLIGLGPTKRHAQVEVISYHLNRLNQVIDVRSKRDALRVVALAGYEDITNLPAPALHLIQSADGPDGHIQLEGAMASLPIELAVVSADGSLAARQRVAIEPGLVARQARSWQVAEDGVDDEHAETSSSAPKMG